MTTEASDSVAVRKAKSRIVSFRVDEDDLARLDALARQTSTSRGEVLRRLLVGAQLKSTIDAQALTEVARVHADLNPESALRRDVCSGEPTEVIFGAAQTCSDPSI